MEDGAAIKNNPALMVLLSKQALHKYNVVSDFAVTQIETWPFICSNISIGGFAKIDGADKKISYHIFTKRNYMPSKDGPVELSWFNKLLLKIQIPFFVYEKEKKIAKKNLSSWTRELMWDDTIVNVFVDGEEING